VSHQLLLPTREEAKQEIVVAEQQEERLSMTGVSFSSWWACRAPSAGTAASNAAV